MEGRGKAWMNEQKRIWASGLVVDEKVGCPSMELIFEGIFIRNL